MKIAGKEVRLFRCHIDPVIGPKPRNAFLMSDLMAKAYINETETAIVVNFENGSIKCVPFTNIQMFELEPEKTPMKTKKTPEAGH